jgi:hypothetical protein
MREGHKFPYNACEVLCSENNFIINKFFEEPVIEEKPTELDKNSTCVEGIDNTGEFFGRKSIIEGRIENELKEMSEKAEDTKIDDKSDLNNNPHTDINDNLIKENELNNVINDQTTQIENNQDEKIKIESSEILDNIDKELLEANEAKAEKALEYPVINYLFTFLQSKEPLNYVLSGYFTKVLSHLFNYRSGQLMSYLFFHKLSFLDDMVNHLNRKSIGEALIKVLVSYSAEIHDQDIKRDLIEKIIDSFDASDNEVK